MKFLSLYNMHEVTLPKDHHPKSQSRRAERNDAPEMRDIAELAAVPVPHIRNPQKGDALGRFLQRFWISLIFNRYLNCCSKFLPQK